ncbi:hypothetical protein JY651_04960 [Pyxidicoccus parkwayensis]|uniref:Uncharacterized protein n=1 Tax=Pyxidicoccus parkwayensis TaxID=2813578 RepID=A0ABX7P0T6_9BACT|nr:hypothetical protein [Pyxidicoccus parkwaysis]QSQ24321.1 hypothetical protein JY651_04960 [Pyxidicoccus parkwaysis]
MSAHRLACEGRFCLWEVTFDLGPCSAAFCGTIFLTTSDLEGHALHAFQELEIRGSRRVRFLGPHQVEVITVTTAEDDDGSTPSAVDSTSIRRTVLKLSRDGKKLELDANASRVPEWKMQSARPSRTPRLKPATHPPVGEDVLSKAQAACESETPLLARHHECREGTCVLIASPVEHRNRELESGANEFCGGVCLVLVKGQEVRRPPVGADADCIEVTPTAYLFSGPMGIRGAEELFDAMSRSRPGYMAFSGDGGHAEGANPYPIREAKTLEAARVLAPTVHAYTVVHVGWGLEHWKGDKDLALAWQLMRAGDTLRLHAEVDDDVVVPFRAGAGSGIHSDHLELTVWNPNLPSTEQGRPVLRKLGMLLAEKGQVQVRLWTGDEDAAYAPAQGTWGRRSGGYVVDVTLPLEVFQELKPLGREQVSVQVSDADARGQQETLMGHEAGLDFWTEYPPSIDEYQRHTGEAG